MFCAFNRLEKPELYASLRTATLQWAGTGQRRVWLAAGPDEGRMVPESGNLDATELARLKEESNNAREGQDFGGFISGNNLLDPKGWCNFKLNPARTEARLTGLVLDSTLAEVPPLQNPALHLALLALLKEMPGLEALILSFGEFSTEDQAALKMFGLAPAGEGGRWLTNQAFERKTDFMTLGLDLITPIWYELKIKVDPALFELVSRLFLRFGFRDKTRYLPAVKKSPQGEEIEDETGQYTVITYLPDNDRHTQNLADLQAALRHISLVSPLPELEAQRVTRLGANYPYNRSLNRDNIFRVGRNIIIQTIHENRPDEPLQLTPTDLLVKVKYSLQIFGPQQKIIHPTSQLCLELLEDYFDPAQHQNILDLGTGSGTLAIAAARLGAKRILAIDPNREAVDMARLNVILNGLEAQIVAEPGSLGLKDIGENAYNFSEELQQRPPSLDSSLPFDAILANIYATNLITMSAAISDALKPGGLLISSGISANSVQAVIDAYEKVGLELVEKRQLHAWCSFVSRKV